MVQHLILDSNLTIMQVHEFGVRLPGSGLLPRAIDLYLDRRLEYFYDELESCTTTLRKGIGKLPQSSGY
jgi:hypothetical protein